MVKNPPANSGDIKDAGSIPELGRSQGEGTGDPLQYSSLENSMDRGTWRATVHGITKSPTGLNRLSLYARMHAQTYLWMRLIRRNRSLSLFFFLVFLERIRHQQFHEAYPPILCVILSTLEGRYPYPLEKGMAIRSSILAWEISWTEETGRLHGPWGCKESDTTEQLKSSKGPLFTPLYG